MKTPVMIEVYKQAVAHRFNLSDIKIALDTAEQGSAIKVAIIND